MLLLIKAVKSEVESTLKAAISKLLIKTVLDELQSDI